MFALGDSAAVPDVAKGDETPCARRPRSTPCGRAGTSPRTSSRRCGDSRRGPYVHKDLGLVVDLGGTDAVSKPFGLELHALPAQAVARGYHWSALRTGVAKTRVMTNWLLNAVADDFVRTGFQAHRPGSLRDFEYLDAYLTPEQVRQHVTEAGRAAR
ncbi:hypothetical protein GCM10023238_37240 [Streptomyces heliomycini]